MAKAGSGQSAEGSGQEAAESAVETPAAAGEQPAAEAPAEAKPAKAPKTYTKAELDAAAAKAAADAIKKAADEKDLSDLEKANNRIKELEGQTRLRDAKDAVVDALTKAGARSSELLWKTLKGDLEFDDAGKLKNLDALLAGIKTDYPEQFGEEKPAESIDGGAGGKGTGGKLTQAAIEKMTPAEINSQWDDVKAVLAKG